MNSTTVTANADGSWSGQILYTAFGEIRSASGNTPTQYRFTGQLSQPEAGLIWFNSRFYDPSLAHFVQADTVIPGWNNKNVPSGAYAWDRFNYTGNNPIIRNDPTGHCFDPVTLVICVAAVTAGLVGLANAAPTIAEAAPQVAEEAPAVENAVVGTLSEVVPAAENALSDITEALSPEVEKAGDALEKVFGGKSENVTSTENLATKNSNGDPYPNIIDPRTEKPIPAPPLNLEKVEPSDRVEWGNEQRGEFIGQWIKNGYKVPQGGWELYDIHHIIPREYGGTNVFENLVPVLRQIHQFQINPWWAGY